MADMTLQASGTLRDTAIMGGRLPELTFDTTIADGALKGTVNGRFENFDPATIASRPDLKGNVSGTVDASVSVRDLSGPITPEAIAGSGQVMLEDSTVAGLEIEGATVDATYENQVANVRQFTLSGPDLKADASGQVALDRTSSSSLKYHIEALDIPALAKLAGQEGIGGTAILDGTVTGNLASLTTTGTLNGSNLSYQDNSALDLNSAYTVTVPELEFAKAHVEAKTEGAFIKAGALEINELTATTTYDQQKLAFVTNIKEQTRELAARGDVILHPDHQEIHLPEFAVRTQGVEWRLRQGTEATIEVRAEPGRAGGRRAGER